jgi:hypothetical protein
LAQLLQWLGVQALFSEVLDDRRDWRKLCAAVAKEKDETKLLALMEELLVALQEREGSTVATSGEKNCSDKTRRQD